MGNIIVALLFLIQSMTTGKKNYRFWGYLSLQTHNHNQVTVIILD